MANPGPQVRRFRRGLIQSAATLCLAAIFLVAVVLGAVLHLNLPTPRRAAAELLEKFLTQSLKGTFKIESIERLDNSGATILGLEVQDPNGRVVLRLKRLVADVNALSILERTLAHHEKLSIEISRVTVSDAELLLVPARGAEEQAAANLSLVEAFEPNFPSEQRDPEARPLRIWFPDVEFRNIFARGRVGDSPLLEAHVPHAKARILTTDRGTSVDINSFRATAAGIAGADASATGELHVRAPGAIWGSVAGKMGEVAFSQSFRVEDSRVSVKGDFPGLEPSSIRPLLPSWPLDQTISIHQEISGKLPLLQVKVELSTPAKNGEPIQPVKVSGWVTTSPGFHADLNVAAPALNLHDYLSTLPKSKLDTTSSVQVEVRAGHPEVTVSSHLRRGTLSDFATPELQGQLVASSEALHLDVQATEPGLTARLHAQRDAEKLISYQLDIAELSLLKNARLAELLPKSQGVIRGRVHGSVKEGVALVDAEISASQVNLSNFSATTMSATIHGKVPIHDPWRSEVQIRSTARSGAVAFQKYSDLELNARGPIKSPQVNLQIISSRGVTYNAEAIVDPLQKELREFSASIVGQGVPIEASARRLSAQRGRFQVVDLKMKSIGTVVGNIDAGAAGGHVDLTAAGLSLSRLGQALGLAETTLGGELDARILLDVGVHSQGSLALEVRNGRVAGVDKISLKTEATIDGRSVEGKLTGTLQSLGSLTSTWSGELDGPLLSPGSIQRGVGRFQAELREVDLSSLGVLVGERLGIPPLTGTLTASAEIDRSDGSQTPGIELSVKTRRLTAKLGEANSALLMQGVDVHAVAALASGKSLLESVIRFDDDRGTLLSVSGSIDLPLSRWMTEAPDARSMLLELRDRPLNLVAVVPKRPIQKWPRFIPRRIERGAVSGRLAVSGTANSPIIGIVANATGMAGETSPLSEPVDLEFNARYLASSGALSGHVDLSRDQDRVGTAQFDVVIPMAHLVHPPEGEVPLFTGNVQLQLDRSPLALLRELDAGRIRGTAQGSIVWQRDGWDPQLSADIQLRGLSLGGRNLGDAVLTSQTHAHKLTSRAEFTDEYGTLVANAEVGYEPTSTLMQLSERTSVFATIESEQYDAAVLLPFVGDTFDELAGALTGKLSAEWTPPKEREASWTTELSGHMAMTDGLITLSGTGMPLSAARFVLDAKHERGLNVVRITGAKARAESKVDNLGAQAELYFKNLDFDHGSFKLTSEQLPIKNDGQPIATISGTAAGRFIRAGDDVIVELGIDDLLTVFPKSADHTLIDVEENETIEVLQRPKKIEAVAEPGSGAVVLKVALGDRVRLKSDIMDLRLRGKTEVRLSESVQLRGAIDVVTGGQFTVMGRRFIVERGTVMFGEGDPADPGLGVAASWKAPNGVLVRVTVTGTAQAPMLAWSSEPALAGGEAEVLALILGGGDSSGGASSLAMAANEAIGQSGLQGVEFYTTQDAAGVNGRMASLTDSTWDSYTTAVRVSDKVWFEGAYTRETPGPGSLARSGVSGTVDWRFHPLWSARTEIGTLGAGMELVWQYRY